MAKKKVDSKKESQKITSEMLSKHASVLTSVLYRLRKDYPDLTTDDLWSAIREHWDVKAFQNAIRHAKKNLRPFKSLIKLATTELPRADKDGFIVINRKKFGTAKAIGRLLHLSAPTVQKHFGSECKQGKMPSGQIYRFYPVDPIIKACQHLLKPVPKADKDGFFRLEGRRYGTMEAFIRELNLSNTSVKTRTSKLRGRKGKIHTGHLATFYHDESVYKACSDLLADVPRTRKGFVIIGGKEWGSSIAIAKRLGIGQRTILVRCKKHQTATIKGLNSQNIQVLLYPFQEIWNLCADLLKIQTRLQKNGFVRSKGELWGTSNAITERLKLSHAAITKRIPSCRHIEGKDYHGHRRQLYSLTDAKRETASLRNLPSADPNGLIKLRGELWGTIWALAPKIGVSAGTIRKNKRKIKIRKIRALDRAGHATDFFSYLDIKFACVDTLKKQSVNSDPITKNNLKRYASTLSRVLYELRRKHPSLTSDQLWKKITKQWSSKQLASAVAEYRKTKRVTRFRSLLES